MTAVGYNEDVVRKWSVKTNELILSFEVPRNSHDFTVGCNGQFIISRDHTVSDSRMRVWSTITGESFTPLEISFQTTISAGDFVFYIGSFRECLGNDSLLVCFHETERWHCLRCIGRVTECRL